MRRNPLDIPQKVITAARRLSKKGLEKTRIYHNPETGGWAIATEDEVGSLPADFFWVLTIDPMSSKPMQLAPDVEEFVPSEPIGWEGSPQQRRTLAARRKEELAAAQELKAHRARLALKRGKMQRDRPMPETATRRKKQGPVQTSRPVAAPSTIPILQDFWARALTSDDVKATVGSFYEIYGDEDFEDVVMQLFKGFQNRWLEAGGTETQEDFNDFLISYLRELISFKEKRPGRELEGAIRQEIVYPIPTHQYSKSHWGEHPLSEERELEDWEREVEISPGQRKPSLQSRMPRPDERKMMSGKQRRKILDEFWEAVAEYNRRADLRRLGRREFTVSKSSTGSVSAGTRRKKSKAQRTRAAARKAKKARKR
jgi:hypothetical protein